MRNRNLTIWVMVVVVMLSGLMNTATAEDTYWVGTTGDWFSPSNWQYKVPESSDKAFIENGGTAEISTGLAETEYLFAGYTSGNGNINHTGGSFSVGLKFHLGQNGGSGSYVLSGTGTLYSGSSVAYVGQSGSSGIFTQTGGNHTSNVLMIGKDSGSSGTYNLSNAGQLTANFVRIGLEAGQGDFTQTGGINNAASLILGGKAGSEGVYNLFNGQLISQSQMIGQTSVGIVNHSGGTNTTYDIYIGTNWMSGSGGSGTYNLSGSSTLSITNNQYIGAKAIDSGQSGCNGTLNQTNGENLVGNNLILGHDIGTNGRYTISGGTLNAQEVEVGYWGTGRFDIDNSAASITVSDLFFGADSIFTAVPDSTIHITGSSLDNWNTDPADLFGFNNLDLIFEGGVAAGVGTLEVAGEDIGAVMSGFDENFAFDALILGGVDIGQVQLVDWRDNMAGTEALYVKDLVLGSGSYLDLNGLNLYYQNFMDYGGTIDLNGGQLEYVPEPATLLLLGLGAMMLRRRG